jgi:ABC-type branched-subunit amino acid transport system permease subunit
VAGPLVGAVFFVLVRDILAINLTNFHLIIFGTLFILVVLLLPGGLLELWDRVTHFKKTLRPLKAVETPAEIKGGEEMT